MCQSRPFTCELIQSWRLNAGLGAIHFEIAIAEVVAGDKENVGFVCESAGGDEESKEDEGKGSHGEDSIGIPGAGPVSPLAHLSIAQRGGLFAYGTKKALRLERFLSPLKVNLATA